MPDIKLSDGNTLKVGPAGTHYISSTHEYIDLIINEIRDELWRWGREHDNRKIITSLAEYEDGWNLTWVTVATMADQLSPSMTSNEGETRMTNATTGAQKGAKDAKYNLIPVGALEELAKLYGFGATKYAPRNWERGYELSLSYDALQRHANQWWSGEDLDSETHLSHMASVAWHAFTLFTLLKTHPELDDRPGSSISPPFYDALIENNLEAFKKETE